MSPSKIVKCVNHQYSIYQRFSNLSFHSFSDTDNIELLTINIQLLAASVKKVNIVYKYYLRSVFSAYSITHIILDTKLKASGPWVTTLYVTCLEPFAPVTSSVNPFGPIPIPRNLSGTASILLAPL